MTQDRDIDALVAQQTASAATPASSETTGHEGSRNGYAGTLIYGVLVCIWLAVSVWQIWEHAKLREHSHQALLERAMDIATTLEVVVRSQERFGAVSKHRLQAALTELSKTSDVLSVALFSPNGDMVASAGEPFTGDILSMAPGDTHWESDSLALAEGLRLPPLGTKDPEAEEQKVVLIERPPPPPPQEEGEDKSPPPPPESPETKEEDDKPQPKKQFFSPGHPPEFDVEKMSTEDMRAFMKAFTERMRKHRREGRNPRKPPWLSETEYQELFQKSGLQKFIISLSAVRTREVLIRDGWQRAVITAITLIAVAALAAGVRSREQAADLTMRLIRAGEMNTHLREMNAAAAGLAHETRNPLNVVRGLAQIIRKGQANVPDVVQKADTIIEEVDRINSRLDQFISYAKPCQPQLGKVDMHELVRGIADALQYDMDEKEIHFSQSLSNAAVLADAEMLRQVVFNLVLNACQAVDNGGNIEIAMTEEGSSCILTVKDDGPGIPADRQEDIFRPYVTYSEQGTGLGLAIVRQIVLAHHWDISCTGSANGGAEFRVSGISRVPV